MTDPQPDRVVFRVEEFIRAVWPSHKVAGIGVIDRLCDPGRSPDEAQTAAFRARFRVRIMEIVTIMAVCPDRDKRLLLETLRRWREADVFDAALLDECEAMIRETLYNAPLETPNAPANPPVIDLINDRPPRRDRGSGRNRSRESRGDEPRRSRPRPGDVAPDTAQRLVETTTGRTHLIKTNVVILCDIPAAWERREDVAADLPDLNIRRIDLLRDHRCCQVTFADRRSAMACKMFDVGGALVVWGKERWMKNYVLRDDGVVELPGFAIPANVALRSNGTYEVVG